jgi:hypothetical protein
MDLIVNGQEQMTTSNQIQAVFGAGWYDLEQHGNYQWRWATSPAVVYVYSPSPQKVKIASTAGSLFSNQPSSGLGEQGVLEITTNGENIANLSVHTGQSFAAETELQTGWNVIVIELEAGNFIPAEIDPASGDARQLSFSLDKINILTE